MSIASVELDLARHQLVPYAAESVQLQRVLPVLRKRSLPIELKAGFDRACWDVDTVVEAAGVSADGRWFLLMFSVEETRLWEFSSRSELCRHLWDSVLHDPAALHILHQLGALTFDADCHNS